MVSKQVLIGGLALVFAFAVVTQFHLLTLVPLATTINGVSNSGVILQRSYPAGTTIQLQWQFDDTAMKAASNNNNYNTNGKCTAFSSVTVSYDLQQENQPRVQGVVPGATNLNWQDLCLAGSVAKLPIMSIPLTMPGQAYINFKVISNPLSNVTSGGQTILLSEGDSWIVTGTTPSTASVGIPVSNGNTYTPLPTITTPNTPIVSGSQQLVPIQNQPPYQNTVAPANAVPSIDQLGTTSTILIAIIAISGLGLGYLLFVKRRG